MSLVLDSSATLAWIYGDETTDAIRAVFDQVIDKGAVVPVLWRLEVANSLTIALRRGRIKTEFRKAALSDLSLLDITTNALIVRPGTRRSIWLIASVSRSTMRLSRSRPMPRTAIGNA